MKLNEFRELLESTARPIVLLEGRRKISSLDYAQAKRFGHGLAARFPRAVFRSGNAEGSDEAFSEGVAALDASRLHVVAPYAAHRRRHRYSDAFYDSPESMPRLREEPILRVTIAATPRNRDIFAPSAPPRLAAKASYLIRDTMKTMGYSEEAPAPTVACFMVDLADPEAGGTGHTIRICRQTGVPVVFQDDWATWVADLENLTRYPK